MTERFQPGGVTHALVSGLVELALAAALLAWSLSAELDDEAVVLHGLGGARRYRYGDLSAVEVSGRRTRLVGRDGTTRVVRGVRGAAQGNRFRARVLERARAAVAGGSGGLMERSDSPPVDSLPAGSPKGPDAEGSDHG
jgi:hypothetical protein